MPELHLSQHDEADKLLSEDPFALLVGMVLDQQIPLEKAFMGPLILQQRLKKAYDARTIAKMNYATLEKAFVTVPALHRFPAANAKRVQALAQIIVDEYDGDAANVWGTAKSGAELLKRVNALPGFGIRKAQIFVALLGKQLGVRPKGWKQACTPFGDAKTTMSIADIYDETSLLRVREWKKATKAATKAAAEKSAL